MIAPVLTPRAARTVASNAIQIADRFHLRQNLGTAVERSVRRHNNCLKSATVSDEGLTNDAVADHADAEKEMSPIEARNRERHATVHALLDQGHGIREMARELHRGGNTVRRTARAETRRSATICDRGGGYEYELSPQHLRASVKSPAG
ncbi:hypothetical protein ACFRKB_28685 [Streptomyces scopuliridis]|uniref:hypothetical protein n=1 Tax=Streptomyces scopuliridis TaxID=452529 RepID=UPI0036C4A68A